MGVRLVILLATTFLSGCGVNSTAPEKVRLPAACSAVAAKYPDLKGRALKIVMTGTQPPFTYLDIASGKLAGLDVEMATATAECLGSQHSISTMAFSAMIPALEAGNADLIWSDLYYSPERGSAASFVLYLRAMEGVVTAVGNPLRLTDLGESCGRRWSTVVGSLEDRIAREEDAKCRSANRAPIVITAYPDGSAVARAVINGRADLAMTDLVLARRLVRTHSGALQVAFVARGIETPVGVAIRKGDAVLTRAVAEAVGVLQTSGYQGRLMKRYGLDLNMIAPVSVRAGTAK